MAKEYKTPESTSIQGNTFREALSQIIGKNFTEITSTDVENWAKSKAYKKSDINAIKRGFEKFKEKDARFVMQDEGFEVVSDGQPIKGSGRKIGSEKGFQLSDVIGLGRDVSTLGGAIKQDFRRNIDKVESLKPQTSIKGTSLEGPTFDSTKEGKVSGAKTGMRSEPTDQSTSVTRKKELQKQVSDTPLQLQPTEQAPELATSPDMSVDLKSLFGVKKQPFGIGEGVLGTNKKISDIEPISDEDKAKRDLLSEYKAASNIRQLYRKYQKRSEIEDRYKEMFGEDINAKPQSKSTTSAFLPKDQRALLSEYNKLKQDATFSSNPSIEEKLSEIRKVYKNQYGVNLK